MGVKRIQSIEDLQPDPKNANLGTERGRGMRCICENCGKVFYAEPNRVRAGRAKNCCLKCSYASRSRNARRRIEHICLWCGKTFYITHSRAENGRGKYCSKECKRLSLGEMKMCPICHKQFWAYKKDNRIYCSKICADAAPEKSKRARASALVQWADSRQRAKLLRGIKLRSESPEWRGAAHFQRGALHPRYKGNKRARLTDVGRYRYKLWHKMVLAQANYTCDLSGFRGGKLEAHHIQAWAEYPEGRYAVSNGAALSIRSHHLLHSLERSCQMMG